jgi:hypothetical protein
MNLHFNFPAADYLPIFCDPTNPNDPTAEGYDRWNNRRCNARGPLQNTIEGYLGVWALVI